MITVNGKEIDWIEGEKIGQALERADAYHPFMVVSLRGECLRKKEWGVVEVNDGDEIRTVEVIAGG